MKRNAIVFWAATATVLSLYGCSAQDPLPFDPAKMQSNSRQVAGELPNVNLQPIQQTLDQTYKPRSGGVITPATKPATQPTTGRPLNQDPTLRMTLQEVIHRTVNNNMDIRVAGYEPAVNSNRVVEAESRFDPTFFFNPFYQWSESAANTSSFTLGDVTPSRVWGAATGIRQELESGGTGELRYEGNEYYAQRDDTSMNPASRQFWSNNLVGELKQPLLKNFGSEVARARITISRNDQRISLLDYRSRLEQTLIETEQNYWQLMFAEREVDIAERLLAETVSTAQLLARRGEEDVTRVQTAQATSAIRQREAVLVRARSRVRDLSDQLKRQMNDPELPVAGDILVLPQTAPLSSPVFFDAQDQINQALEHRLELAQQLLRLESASLITRVAKNNLLPALSFVQTVTANGASVDYDQANYSMVDFDAMSYRATVQFEIPIGNRQAHAIYQRTLLQRQQAVDQYRAIVDQVSLDVKTALRNVETSWDEMAANRQAVLSAADTLDAISTRLERGGEPWTPNNVQLRLDSQQRLAEAARNEAQAIASYSVSIAQLERAKGTLLKYDNVLMVEDRMNAVQRGKVLDNVRPPMQSPAPAVTPTSEAR